MRKYVLFFFISGARLATTIQCSVKTGKVQDQVCCACMHKGGLAEHISICHIETAFTERK